MKKRLTIGTATRALLAGLTLWPWLSGCGGGGGSPGAAGETGALRVSVDFPSPGGAGRANLPAETQRVDIAVSGLGLTVPLTASLTPNLDSVSFNSVPVGPKQVLATAHGATGDNTILAGGFDVVTIEKDVAAAAELVMGPPLAVSTERFVGDKTIQGVQTAVLKGDEEGEETYLTADADGVKVHGYLNVTPRVRSFLVETEEVFSPPLLLIPAGALPGHTASQTLNVFIDGLLLAQNEATATYEGPEAIKTPLSAEPLLAAKVVVTEQYTPVGQRQEPTWTGSTTLWLVPGIGPAAMLETDSEGLPELRLLVETSLTAAAPASTTRQFSAAAPALTPDLLPVQPGAWWRYVELAKRALGDVDATGVPADQPPA